jgi:hypothetical protein
MPDLAQPVFNLSYIVAEHDKLPALFSILASVLASDCPCIFLALLHLFLYFFPFCPAFSLFTLCTILTPFTLFAFIVLLALFHAFNLLPTPSPPPESVTRALHLYSALVWLTSQQAWRTVEGNFQQKLGFVESFENLGLAWGLVCLCIHKLFTRRTTHG